MNEKGKINQTQLLKGGVSIPELIVGKDGLTPYIKDGNWWIGETDTGVKAEGKDGADGKSAYEIVVEYGYEGTEEEWANGLNPDKLVEKVLDNMEQAEDWVL
jgi:hypothetical protein